MNVGFNMSGFGNDLRALFAESEAAGRKVRGSPFLDYEQWTRFGQAAVRAGLVSAEELNGAAPRDIKGTQLYLSLRHAVLNAWERVAEAVALGVSAEQFMRDEMAETDRQRAESDARARQDIYERQSRAKRPRRFTDKDDL